MVTEGCFGGGERAFLGKGEWNSGKIEPKGVGLVVAAAHTKS